MDLTEEVLAWLRSPPGRAAVQRTADRNGVAYLVDDLVSDVLYRAVVHDGTPVDSVPAFTTTLLRRAAIDLLRGERRRVAPARYEPGMEHGGDEDDPADVVVHAEQVDELRRALWARLGTRPWVGSACLARLAAELDHATISGDAPHPSGGAGEQDALDWAALWYAGQDDCFPRGDGTDDPATRQRRSRAIKKVRSHLQTAAADIEEATTGG